MTTTKENCASFAPEIVSGNIFIRPVVLQKKGDFVDGHEHTFDHTTIFFTGSVHVHTKDPSCGCEHDYDFTAPAHLLIKKGIHHLITATSAEGATFWCVYSHRDQQGEVVQEMDNMAVYS